jgi:hypothetical protein
MQRVRTIHLIIAALILSAPGIVSTELRMGGYLSFDSSRIVAYVVFLFNAAAAIVGLWTRYRVAWFVYLMVSIAGMLLISTSTPISALWILTTVAAYSLR